jgi:hypothetical protein
MDTGGSYESLNLQNNTYVMGLLRPIAGSTYPATPNTSFTDGAAQRGDHWAVVHAPLDMASKARAATTALHELGHSNGAAHAPFSVKKAIAKEWVNILGLMTTYNTTGIGVYGQPVMSVPWRSLSAGDLLQGPNQKDIMSYSDPLLRWVSDYNWSIFAKQQKNNADYVANEETVDIPER